MVVLNYIVCYLLFGIIFDLFVYYMWDESAMKDYMSWSWMDDGKFIALWLPLLIIMGIFGLYHLFLKRKSLFKKVNKK